MRKKCLLASVLSLCLSCCLLLSACIISPADRPEETKQRTTKSTTAATTTAVPTEPLTTATTTPAVTTTERTTVATTTKATTTETTTTEATTTETSAPEPPSDTELFPEEFSWLPQLSERMFLRECDEVRFQNFRALYEGAAKFRKSTDLITPVDTDEADILMLMLNYQCPELMQIGGNYFYLIDTVGDEKLVVGIEYVYEATEEEYREQCAAVSAIVEDWCAPLLDRPTFEKEDAIYRNLIDCCSYDADYLYSNSSRGVLLDGIGRCEGYCKTFELMMWRLGVDCGCLTGDTTDGGEGLMARHSWNVVDCDGTFAHVDVTYDDLTNDGEQFPVPYGFFNVIEDYLWESRSIDAFYYDLGLQYCDSMEASYLANYGWIVPEGTDPKTALADCLAATIAEHLFEVRIRYDNLNDFRIITADPGTLIQQQLSRLVSGAWSYRWYYYNDSHVLLITLSY